MNRGKLNSINLSILILAIFLFAGSCAALLLPKHRTPEAETPLPGLVNTFAVQTMMANPNLVWMFYTSTPSPTRTSIQPSATPTPTSPISTDTPTPLSSASQPADTPTLSPTPTQPSATSTPVVAGPCSNSAAFVEDVTIPEGAQMLPNEQFTKIWRIKNNGSCSWKKDYFLSVVSGDPMGATASQAIGQVVKPGETVDIAIDLIAPARDGIYMGGWVLQDSAGTSFSTEGNKYILCWVMIEVKEPWLPSIIDLKDGKDCAGFG